MPTRQGRHMWRECTGEAGEFVVRRADGFGMVLNHPPNPPRTRVAWRQTFRARASYLLALLRGGVKPLCQEPAVAMRTMRLVVVPCQAQRLNAERAIPRPSRTALRAFAEGGARTAERASRHLEIKHESTLWITADQKVMHGRGLHGHGGLPYREFNGQYRKLRQYVYGGHVPWGTVRTGSNGCAARNEQGR